MAYLVNIWGAIAIISVIIFVYGWITCLDFVWSKGNGYTERKVKVSAVCFFGGIALGIITMVMGGVMAFIL